MLSSLTFAAFQPMELDKALNVISLGDSGLWYQCVQGLYRENDQVLLRDENGVVDAPKSVIIIGDVAHCPSYDEIFLKEATSTIPSRFGDTTMNALLVQWQALREQYMQAIWESDLPLECEIYADEADFNKLMTPHITRSLASNAYDKIVEIVEIAGALRITKTLVMFHIAKYMDEDQVRTLVALLCRNSIQLIDLELDVPTRTSMNLSHMTEVRSHSIDCDFVQF